jgi:hypothetical protein
MYPTERYIISISCSTTLLTLFQVQGEAQGANEKLDQFLKFINQGPSHAEVKSVDKSSIDTKNDEASFDQD